MKRWRSFILMAIAAFTAFVGGAVTNYTQASGVNPSTMVARAFDGYGQLTNEQIYIGGTLQNAFAQGWDAGGRRNSLQAPAAAFGYAYQADGRMTGVTAFGATCNFGYANNGLLTSRGNPWRTLTVNARDGQGRLLQQTATLGSWAPLVETLTWRPDSTLCTYTATRAGPGAWNDARTYQYNARGQLTSEPVGVNSSTLATNHYTFDSGLLGVRVGSQESGGLTNGWTGQLNPLAQVASEAWNESSLTLRACGRVGKGGSAAASLDGNAVDATMSWSLINDRWYSDLTLTPGSHSLAVSAYYPAGQFTATVTNAFTVLSTNNVADAFDGAGYVTNRVFASGKTQALTWDAAGRLVGLVQWNNASNGFFWTAIYDALGRRLRTSYVSVINGYTNTLLAATVDAYFDPQVEFEEVGVALNGQRTWKVLGPDLDGHYGSLQGVGGLEATVRESDHNTTPVLNDYCGNVLATVSGPVVFWNPVRVGGYGPVAGYQASPLLGSTPLADTLVWRSRGIDPSGFYNLGARYYDPVAGHFLSPDPLGHAASLDLYSFCGGDPLNRFDPTGRFAKDPVGATGRFIQGFAAGMTDPGDSSGISGYGGFISQTGAARLGYNIANNSVCRLLMAVGGLFDGGEGVVATEEVEATMATEGLDLEAGGTLAREAETVSEESEALVAGTSEVKSVMTGEAVSESATVGEEANASLGAAKAESSLSASETDSGGASLANEASRGGASVLSAEIETSGASAAANAVAAETGASAGTTWTASSGMGLTYDVNFAAIEKTTTRTISLNGGVLSGPQNARQTISTVMDTEGNLFSSRNLGGSGPLHAEPTTLSQLPSGSRPWIVKASNNFCHNYCYPMLKNMNALFLRESIRSRGYKTAILPRQTDLTR